jgi:hypothetical protein
VRSLRATVGKPSALTTIVVGSRITHLGLSEFCVISARQPDCSVRRDVEAIRVRAQERREPAALLHGPDLRCAETTCRAQYRSLFSHSQIRPVVNRCDRRIRRRATSRGLRGLFEVRIGCCVRPTASSIARGAARDKPVGFDLLKVAAATCAELALALCVAGAGRNTMAELVSEAEDTKDSLAILQTGHDTSIRG